MYQSSILFLILFALSNYAHCQIRNSSYINCFDRVLPSFFETGMEINRITYRNVTINSNNTLIFSNGTLVNDSVKFLDNSFYWSQSFQKNCFIALGRVVEIMISKDIVQNIFSTYDPIFFKVYNLIRGDGSNQNTTKFVIGTDPVVELANFYNKLNSSLANLTILNTFDSASSFLFRNNCSVANEYFEYLQQNNLTFGLANIERNIVLMPCKANCNKSDLLNLGLLNPKDINTLISRTSSLLAKNCLDNLQFYYSLSISQNVSDIRLLVNDTLPTSPVPTNGGSTVTISFMPFIPTPPPLPFIPTVPPSILANISSQPVTANNILTNLNSFGVLGFGIGDLYKPTQLGSLDSSSALNLAKSNIKFDQNSALALGPKLPSNTSFGDAARLISAAPIEIISNSPPKDIARNLANVDFDNMNQARKAALATKLLSEPTADNLKSMMVNGTSSLVNMIPLNTFSSAGLDISQFSPIQLPNAVVENFARQKLNTQGISSLLASNSADLTKVVSGLRPSDFKVISNNSKFNGVLKMISASAWSKPLSNVQRGSMFNTLIEGAAFLGKVQSSAANAISIFNQFNSTTFSATAELFIEAPADYLNALANQNISFSFILSQLASYKSSRCNSYSYSARNTFTRYAVQYLLKQNSRSVLIPSDLDTLGPCFAPNIPIEHFRTLSAETFYTRASYFQGIQFQPNSTWINEITSKMTTLAKTYDSKTLFTNLGELVIFHPNLNNVDSSAFESNGKSINTILKSSKNLKSEAVRSARFGVNDVSDSAIETAFSNWQKAYVNYLVRNVKSSRRKRQTSNSITCDQLTEGPPYAFNASLLSGLSNAVFQECVSILGASTNTYTREQISALATKAKAAYSSIYTDSTIQSLNIILTGLTQTELASLKFSSDNTLSVLGAINTWSADQISGLYTALKSTNSINLINKLSFLGNLACGLTQTDLDSITNSIFLSNMANFKIINNRGSCASLSILYSKAKLANGITGNLDSSNFVDFDGLIGGASVSDLIAAGSEVFLSATATGIQNLPASTVNNLPTSYFSSATSNQLAALTSSPYYSSFNDAVKSSIASASGTTYTNTGGSTSNSNRISINCLEILSTMLAAYLFYIFL